MAAVTIGWIVAPPADRSAAIRQAVVLAAVGVAPDLDLLIDRHSQETHSVGAAVIAASVAALRRWPVASDRLRIWVAVFAAWLSHPLLDTIALDTSPPLGVMLLWPFEWTHYQTGWSIFAPISRRYWLPNFVPHNLMAVAREIAILGPLAAAAWWMRVGAARRRQYV
jgi:membrane-bound metal-dependent hydrolase YbcI (DUF457 family)